MKKRVVERYLKLIVSERNVSDLLRQSPEDLAAQINTPGVNLEMVTRLQIELDKLQVALDDSLLQTLTMADLTVTET